MKVEIGTGADSWGVWFPSDPKQIPWDRFLDEAVEAGYSLVELGPLGYLPTDPAVLRAELDRRGLAITTPVTIARLEDPAAWPVLEEQLLGGADLLAPFGNKFILLIDEFYTDLFTGRQIAPARLDDDAWRRLIETTHRAAALVRERFGITALFHPHTDTHVEYEEQVERLIEQTDPELVALCLDTGHHAYRGGDPVAFMRKWHQRIPYLHIKSVDPELQKRVAREDLPFAVAVGMDLFQEPSRGAVDFPAFRDVLREVDYQGIAIVEQDMYPAPFDKPLPIAKRTRAYLREIGLG